MEDDPAPALVPTEWLDALARSEADLVAGRTAPWAEVRARLLAAADEVETTKLRP
jgi:hypothetical protein